MEQVSSRRIAPILGGLCALGPLSIDMYLPSLPKIAASLHVGQGTVQLSVMAFFGGLMLGQLFYGPLSDRTGRKPMIYVGLVLFVIGSIGCAMAGAAGLLIAWRFVQGLGGSIGMVIGLAVVRDLYSGHTAARMVALIMIVMGMAPILAPLLGAAIITIAPWQVLFVILALSGAACAIPVLVALPETRSRELRAMSRPAAAFRNYLHLFVSRHYIPYVTATALGQAGFFAYLSGSSFVFISLYGLTPATYSAVFALNSIGLVISAQFAPRLMRRFRAQAIVRVALATYAAAAVALLGIELIGGAGIVPFAVLLSIIIAAMAFTLPLGGVMALESYATISGTAAALMGGIQFGAGTLSSFVVGIMANGTALPMIGTIALCGVIACLVAFTAFPSVPSLQPGVQDGGIDDATTITAKI